MARKKKASGEHENNERWLVSYADFITLLFAFFVVMFASSQTDKYKAQVVSDSVKDALEKGGVAATVREVLGGTVDDVGKGNAMMKGPGGSTPKDAKPPAPSMPMKQAAMEELAPSMTYLSKALSTEIKDGKIEVSLQPRGLVVSLKTNTFFPSGEDTIDPATYGIVDKIGKVVLGTKNPVRLEGHTDSQPIHTERFPSNWVLSSSRAVAMLNLLISRCKVPEARLAIAGYADTIPVDTNETAEGRRHNRRVDIVVLSQVLEHGSLAAEPTKAATASPAAPARPPSDKPKPSK